MKDLKEFYEIADRWEKQQNKRFAITLSIAIIGFIIAIIGICLYINLQWQILSWGVKLLG
jgi:hypothetical protein